MIETLEIRNFALIEGLRIDFCRGFNVLTGETGAGKSIILGALNLLMGAKADPSSVRSGEEECVVSAVLGIPSGHPVLGFLKERGIEPEDGELFVRRRVRSDGGRGTATAQGQRISRSELAFLCQSLIDLHSQREHLSLLRSEKQLRVLDAWGAAAELLGAYQERLAALRALARSRKALAAEIEKAREDEDYLRYTIDQIKALDPKPGEEEELKAEIARLANYEALSESLGGASNLLRTAKDSLYEAASLLGRAKGCDPSLAPLHQRASSLEIEAEDLYETLRDRTDGLAASPERLDSLQERLVRLGQLKRRCKKATLAEVVAYRERAEALLENAASGEEELSRLDGKVKDAEAAVQEAADRLTQRRKEAAGALGRRIEEALAGLGMPSGRFRIDVAPGALGPSGQDEVAFLISPNKGEALRPMAQIASGGELSRIMLAAKTVLAEADDTQTQVFDEVDSGIGGAVAQAVGRQLARLASVRQVVAITHLASIASAATAQFVVSKTEEGGRTFTSIRRADGQERVRELARMLSGGTDEAALAHAGALLEAASKARS